jgi:hypothetical protein
MRDYRNFQDWENEPVSPDELPERLMRYRRQGLQAEQLVSFLAARSESHVPDVCTTAGIENCHNKPVISFLIPAQKNCLVWVKRGNFLQRFLEAIHIQ